MLPPQILPPPGFKSDSYHCILISILKVCIARSEIYGSFSPLVHIIYSFDHSTFYLDENALICIQSEIVVKVENHVGKEVIKEAYHTYTEVVPAKNTKWQVEAASDAQGAGGSGNHGCKKKVIASKEPKEGFYDTSDVKEEGELEPKGPL